MTIEWYNGHSFVFTARIDSVEDMDSEQYFGGPGPKVYLSTEIIYKGEVPKKLAITPRGFHSSCEFHLDNRVGLTFIFYANLDETGVINSHFCDGSKRLYSIQELNTMNIHQVRSLKQELQFLKDISLQTEGEIKTYYSNGKLTGTGNFEKGMPVGYWRYYTFEGKISAEGMFKLGLKNGQWMEYEYQYNEQKKKLVLTSYEVGEYKNGLRNGEWKTYYPNGKYWMSENYKEGNYAN
jgi:hypothetical protein